MLESHSREPVQPMQAWKIDFKSNMMMMLQECFLILLQYFLSIFFLNSVFSYDDDDGFTITLILYPMTELFHEI